MVLGERFWWCDIMVPFGSELVERKWDNQGDAYIVTLLSPGVRLRRYACLFLVLRWL